MKRIHFDLRHIEATEGLEIRIRGQRLGMQRHDDRTRLAAVAHDPALAAVPTAELGRFSHFIELADHHVAGNTPIHVHLVTPELPGVHLPQVVAMTILVPEAHLEVFWTRHLALHRQPMAHVRSLHRPTITRRPRVHHATLAHLGVKALPGDAKLALATLVNAQYLVTPLNTAAALVSHHPNLANTQPSTAANILHNHILPDPDIDPDQYNAMQTLAAAIAAAGAGWSPVVPCTDKDGNPIKAGYDLLDPDGAGIKDGQQLYTYSLTDDVTAQMGPACGGANQSASDDMSLANDTWAPKTGTTALVSRAGDRTMLKSAGIGDTSFKWTVNEQTEHHGVSIDPGSIKIDAKGNFSINAGNSYLRTLYTGYQLLDQSGKRIGGTEVLGSISATNTILGIPVPTDPTALEFNLGTASGARLLFGSLGVTDWDADVSWRGALLTCLWQYGVPCVLLVAGKSITSSATFNKIVNDKDLRLAALAVGGYLVAGGVAGASALFNTKKVLFSFGNVVLSMALQAGMKALGEWLTAQVTAGAVANAFGPVGWALRAVATAMDFEQMAVTTGEVLSSPACITATVSRAVDVSLTLLPDPRHGEAGKPETAVWPSVAQRYVVTLQYQDGTNRQLIGALPETTGGTPLALLFADIPAGGQFRIIAGVYSDSGWLAGTWQSDWITALPNKGSTLDLGSQAITEKLVPLAQDTQYVFKERIVSENNTFAWKAGAPPKATMATLDGGSGALSELVAITINNSAYQIGYAWRASGQKLPPNEAKAPPSDAQLYVMQNLSVLGKPGSVLKTSDVGLTNRPGLAYAPSTNQTSEVDQTNFILDPRSSTMNLRQVVLDDQTGTFDLGTIGLKSWGQFPLANIDALAVHPDNIVLACSFKDSKLMLLKLPKQASADADAPMALMVSGEGIRQGLMRGPKAMAVAPDGRILILESANLRVQAFDTKGNPVPSFTPDHQLLDLATAAIAPELDQGKLPDPLVDALIAAGIGRLFDLDSDFVAQLDKARFSASGDPLIAALSQKGVNLSYDPDYMDDPKLSATISVVRAGESWIIRDPRGFAWQIQRSDGGLAVSARVVDADVRVVAAGSQWLVTDRRSLQAWKLIPSTADATRTQVLLCLSFFPLKAARVGGTTFLDMAVEAQGYIYVLSYFGDGTDPVDYVLDVYAPDGSFCFRSPDPSVTRSPQNVVAGRIAVDIWRNLFGLTYEKLTSPWGTPQPGIGHWTPTPPLFSLPLSAQADFNQLNIGAVVRDFAANGVTLSNKAFIVVVDANGAWKVKDQGTVYDVYRSGDGLQTYAIPA